MSSLLASLSGQRWETDHVTCMYIGTCVCTLIHVWHKHAYTDLRNHHFTRISPHKVISCLPHSMFVCPFSLSEIPGFQFSARLLNPVRHRTSFMTAGITSELPCGHRYKQQTQEEEFRLCLWFFSRSPHSLSPTEGIQSNMVLNYFKLVLFSSRSVWQRYLFETGPV